LECQSLTVLCLFGKAYVAQPDPLRLRRPRNGQQGGVRVLFTYLLRQNFPDRDFVLTYTERDSRPVHRPTDSEYLGTGRSKLLEYRVVSVETCRPHDGIINAQRLKGT